ncbi:MAG: hypothetical protein EOM26_05665 [Alphaproteobacteria bacterium]|nr:hypothetical protein [Alphaproteobacteria bacterium]
MSGKPGNKAIILTARDVLVDTKAPYVEAIRDLYTEIFSGFIGQEHHGIKVEVPDELFLRDVLCRNCSLKENLDGILYGQRVGGWNSDPDALLAQALRLTAELINQQSPSERIVRERFEETGEGSLHETRFFMQRDLAITEALKPRGEQFDAAVKSNIVRDGLFIPEALGGLREIINTGCQICIIHIGEDFAGMPVNVFDMLKQECALEDVLFCHTTHTGLERFGVKDLFPELECVADRDVLVFTNHVGLLSDSTRRKPSVLMRAHAAALFDGGHAGRIKDAPHAICMIGYNPDSRPDMTPFDVLSPAIADTPDELVQVAGRFSRGEIAHSFHRRRGGAPTRTGAPALVTSIFGEGPGI